MNGNKKQKIQIRATVVIADINSKPVLCAKACEELNLIKRIFKQIVIQTVYKGR